MFLKEKINKNREQKSINDSLFQIINRFYSKKKYLIKFILMSKIIVF